MKTAPAQQWPLSASPPAPAAAAAAPVDLSFLAPPSSSSAGLSISLSPVSVQAVPESPPESFLTCVEKFFLCEHKNALNIALFASTFALFVSDGFARKVPLIPPTSRSNVVYKVLVSAGLLAQLIFEIKNVDRSVWLHSRAVGSASAAGKAIGTPQPMYRMPSAFSLSPAPINFTSPIHNAMTTAAATNISANGGSALPLPQMLPAASTSNLTAVDRQLESVGQSLLMLAFNSLMLKVFFQRPLGARGDGLSRWECNTVTKLYTVANALGMLGALKGMVVAVYQERTRRRSIARMMASNNVGELPSAIDPAPSSAASAATADPHRSLPLLLPSFSFIQLIHALFIYPQSRTRVTEILDASVSAAVPAGSAAAAAISKAASSAGAAASSSASSSLMSSVPILRVMACLSLFYWNAHYKSVDCNGSGSNESTLERGGPPPSFLRGNTQLAYNCKMIACLLLFTKLMAGANA